LTAAICRALRSKFVCFFVFPASLAYRLPFWGPVFLCRLPAIFAPLRNIIKYGIIGLGILAVYKIYSKGQVLGNLKLDISKISYAFDSAGVMLTLWVNVSNAIAEQVKLNYAKGDLYFNDQKIGTFDNPLQIVIPGPALTLVPFTVRVGYEGISSVLMDVINGSTKQNATFRAVGDASIDDIPFPFNLKYSML